MKLLNKVYHNCAMAEDAIMDEIEVINDFKICEGCTIPHKYLHEQKLILKFTLQKPKYEQS